MDDHVVIVQASSVPLRQIAGALTATRGELVAVAAEVHDEHPLSFKPGEPVIIVRDGPEGRAAVRATFMGSDKDAFWFQVPGNTWVVEERKAPRPVVDEACEVVGATLGERVHGTIMDISEGGAPSLFQSMWANPGWTSSSSRVD